MIVSIWYLVLFIHLFTLSLVNVPMAGLSTIISKKYILPKDSIELSLWEAISLLDTFSKHVFMQIHATIFMAVLLLTAKNETTQMVVIYEWIKKTWYNHHGIFHSKKEVLSHTTIWMNLEDVTLSESSQAQKIIQTDNILFHLYEIF